MCLLLLRGEKIHDLEITHEAITLSELHELDILDSLVIWYDLFFPINVARKTIHEKNCKCLQSSRFDKMLQWIFSTIEKHTLQNSIMDADTLAKIMGNEISFLLTKRIYRKKKKKKNADQDNFLLLSDSSENIRNWVF